MRELIEKNEKITVVPHNFKNANRGVITEVTSQGFTIELESEAVGFLKHNYCEFYTNNKNGMLYFNSYPKEINGNSLLIVNPAKHKYLQRRQYTRVKYVNNIELYSDDEALKVLTLDISAGGMKFKTSAHFDIDKEYSLTLSLAKNINVSAKFLPIRIERNNEGSYTLSGRFAMN